MRANEIRVERARERARHALFTATTFAEAVELYGAHRQALRLVSKKVPELHARYVELSDVRTIESRAQNIRRASARSAEIALERREILLDDLDMMIRSGVSRDEAARRVGKSWDSLERYLYRAKRGDMVARLKRN